MRQLCFQQCAACGTFRHPPGGRCPSCHSTSARWIEAPSIGHVYSYTVVHHPGHPAAAAAVPYNVVLVEYPECGGVRLVSNVVDAGPGELAVGSSVELVWDEGSNGRHLPRYRLVRASAHAA